MKKYIFLLVLFLSLLCSPCFGAGVITPLYDPYAAHIPDDINLGTVEGQMLYWDDVNDLWARTNGLSWDDINSVFAVSDVNYLLADGSVDLTDGWTISTNSITLTAGTLTAEQLRTDTFLYLLDGTTNDYLKIKALDNSYTADRTLTISLANANRTLTVSGNALISDWFDQSVKTTASPIFAKVNTGQGAYELYAMNQDVQTTDAPSFATGTTIGTLTLADGSITDSSGDITFSDANLVTTGTLDAGATTLVTATVGVGNAPLVTRNTNAYGDPWTQYSQVWLDSAGGVMAYIRNDGTFGMGGTQGLMKPKAIAVYSGQGPLPCYAPIIINTNTVHGQPALQIQQDDADQLGLYVSTDVNNIINGKLRIGDTTTPTLVCEIKADSIRIVDTQSPASNGAGTQGEIAWDADFIYVCTATNTWKRAALTGGY